MKMANESRDFKISIIIILSVIVERAVRAVKSVNEQIHPGELEVIIISVGNKEISQYFNFPDLNIKFIFIDQILGIGQLRTIGFEKSSGEILVYLEEHCEFVGRENLEHIKTLAIRGFDCIGGQILIGNEKKHGNPVSALCAFLPFLEPSVTGEYNSLPGYNAAYKRRALESVKKDLPLLFGYEALLLNEILKKKFKIYIEPSVKIKHYFENRNINTLKLSFFYNINFSHARKTYYHWSGFQVVMRTLMAVLIPFTRTIKFLIEIYRSKPGYLSGVLKNIHLVFLIHLSAGLGTLCGYYFWSNRHNVRFTQLEYNIER